MTDTKTHVAVVMSTYNGERYLAEQIDSVLAQKDVVVELFVRDDGSTDSTLELLEKYASESGVHVTAGENLGVVGSFMALLAEVPPEFEYIALCDQDDVWLDDKLARAVAVLSACDNTVPQLYCSEYYFCDETLSERKKSNLNVIGVGFAQLLYETKVSGNTVAINRALADAALAVGAQDIYGHDWWLGLIAAGLGELHFDSYASLLYRRLSSSVSPTGGNPLTILRFRIKAYLKGDELAQITAQLKRYEAAFGKQLEPQKLQLIERFTKGGRFAKVFAPVRLRQAMAEEIALRILFLIGKL